MQNKKTYLYSLLAVVVMAIIAVLFFYPDDIDGRVLQQHDMQQGLANGQEGKAFTEQTGETTRWTNSLFSGMPNFQIAPSYASAPLLNWIANAYQLWLPSPANLLFIMMTGFFIMALCMQMRWYVALFGAIAWGFSTYFIIIIGAGHIWKFITLAYIPPTLGGIWLCYRGKYLGGTALAALFGALQLMSNHVQMTYYFCFVILALMIATLVNALREKKLKQWGIATGCLIGAALLAVGANSASLYNTAEYAKETVRGKATCLTTAQQGTPQEGADFDYITAWSYGGDETLTLLVPNVKGGASIKPVGGENMPMTLQDTRKAKDLDLNEYEWNFLTANGFLQYFGDQPMTNGPVYVGAFVLMLAILALFICRGPLKWCLLGVTILSILLAWGHNFAWFSRIFIDWFPGYNKFRTVSSILVIAEFTIPLLAMMALTRIVEICSAGSPGQTPLKRPGSKEDTDHSKLSSVTLITGGSCMAICLLLFLFPGIMGSGLSIAERDALNEAGYFSNPDFSYLLQAIKDVRMSLVRIDAIRSFVFLLIGMTIVWAYIKGRYQKSYVMTGAVILLCLIDLFAVNKRYINSENFIAADDSMQAFEPNAADEEILKDKDLNYRVYDIDGFGEARSSYFHKTIGGYHAAKLTRYNDLINEQIKKNNPAVLNMLNAKYFMGMARDEQGQPIPDLLGNATWIAQRNPDALGNAWWVQEVKYVDNDNDEMRALDNFDPARTAIANKSFSANLGKASDDITATVVETSYAPNRLTYKSNSNSDGVVVFSEIYFPWGWKATIDGKEVPINRVNYVLRALRVPKGNHEIVFTFDPESLKVTDTVSVIAVIIIYILALGAIGWWIVRMRRRQSTSEGA